MYNMSLSGAFSSAELFPSARMVFSARTHTHTQVYTYVYVYIYVCICIHIKSCMSIEQLFIVI